MAAGLARQGLLPVVNSFASFLASRANEQIYNQASEGTKVVYALHYAGLIPAGPGKSHQSVRDISLLGALPNVTIVQPVNAEETACAAPLGGRGRRRVRRDSSRDRAFTASHRARRRLAARPRQCAARRRRADAACVRAGDACTRRSWQRRRLAARGVDLRVVAMPWLNRFDAEWLEELGDVRGRLRPRGPRPGGRPRRRAAPRARRPDAGDGVRRRGLAGVRNAARGAARARARRPVARGPHRARHVPRAKPVSDGPPVWLVLADPLSTRIFIDCGIAERLARALRRAAAARLPVRPRGGGRLGFPVQRPWRALPA